MSDSEREDDGDNQHLKVVVLGDENVGKTSLIKRLCLNEFSMLYVPTIGADFYMKRLNIKSKEIVLKLTDLGGGELKGRMMTNYLFKIDIAIFVYDVSCKESFDSLGLWLKHLEKGTTAAAFGNKCDVEHNRRVPITAINRFSSENQLVNFNTSAKNGENVESSFMAIVAKHLNLTIIENEIPKEIIKYPIIQQTINNKRKKRNCELQ